MDRRYSIGAYWPARREDANQCARRLAVYFETLSSFGSCIANWKLTGKTKKSAQRTPWINDFKHEQMVELLLAGRNRRDTDRSVIEELGFSVGAWNGRSASNEEAGLSVHCGMYDDAGGKILNAVVLKLPRDLSFLGADKEARLIKLLLAHIDPWNPDWVAAAFRQKSESEDAPREWNTVPILLWVRLGAKPRENNLVADAEVSPIAGGQLIVSRILKK